MKGAYRVALLCGAIPLLAGVSIFLLWLATRWEWLMVAGVVVLVFGLASFAVGVLALGRYCWVALQAPEPAPRFWPATILCAALLLSNFPAAGAILREVLRLESRYTVVVHNQSDAPLEEIRIVGRGHVYAALGTLPGGENATRSFRIAHEGPLHFEARGITATIDGYVTGGQGGLAIVTIGPDGKASILHGLRD